MIREARTAGLVLNEARVEDILGNSPTSRFQKASVDYPLHDSLTALWAPAEFIPKPHYDYATGDKSWRANLFRHRVLPPGALVHASAYLRGQAYTKRLPPSAQRVD